jgi:hypothetical protein
MKALVTLILTAALSLFLTACEKPQTVEQKINSQLSSLHALSDEERALANANAKQFYERSWPNDAGRTVQGQLIACRPSDSNANGLVTCTGYVADLKTGSLVEKKMYCGYRKDLVGCSDQDTVLP